MVPSEKISRLQSCQIGYINIEGKRNEGLQHFGLMPEKPVLLIVGGSQGARSINKSIQIGLNKLSQVGIQVIWQTGKNFAGEAKAAVDASGDKGIKAFDFITRMDLAYAVSDVVIARGGASTVSELCIVAKPSILVPLPTAAEDHQTKNCKALTDKNAALMIADKEANEKLVDTAIELLKNKPRQIELISNIKPLAITDSAERIAKEILSMIAA